MTDECRVRFDGVWKKFRKGSGYDSLRDLIPSLVKSTIRPKPSELGVNDFWALRDVSFEVGTGHALGIIGRNGAGKSTTLKILTKVLAPTLGHYSTKGRVGSLIEVAAGFHPDLTGRENVFLQAAILGLPKSKVESAFDAIVDFAGVEAFIDTPVKRYSSGMNARLGFSIAAHMDPDVLIIDEVLSVGDGAFQAKCIERMRAFKAAGVAIVFVSHNMQAISDLCDTAIHLDGEVICEGPAGEVIGAFLTSMEGSAQTATGNLASLSVEALALEDGSPARVVTPGQVLTQRLSFTTAEALADCSLSLVVIRSTDGLAVHDSSFQMNELGWDSLRPGITYHVTAKLAAHLLRGQYHFQWHLIHSPTNRWLAVLNPAAMFRVDEYRSYGGVVDLELAITGQAE
ncbi:MAG: polysaccharide ABC transporter ATP-binding protein [Gemmatimonadales bacterium]